MRWLVVSLCCAWLVAAIAPAAAEGRRVVGYRHGKRFALRVVDVGAAVVEVKTARAFARMARAARKDGVRLVVWSGFRTYRRQAELYRLWRNNEGNLAARPGYSNHQSGRALDLVIDDDRVYEWLVDHAGRYGFRRTVRGEPWHWEYVARVRTRARR